MREIVYLHAGDSPTRIEVGFSEAAMHLGVAGREVYVTVTEAGMAQLYAQREGDESGELHRFSFPVTPGEAGLYRNSTREEDGYHGYREV